MKRLGITLLRALPGLVLCWASLSASAALMDLSVSVQSPEGVVLSSDATRIVQGVQEFGRAEVRDPLGENHIFAEGTFAREAIAEYVGNLNPGVVFSFTNWVSKSSVQIANAGDAAVYDGVEVIVQVTHEFTRLAEKYAVFGIAPNSAGGVIIGDGELANLNYVVTFKLPGPGFGPSLSLTGGVPGDKKTIFDTVANINQGHELIVDLDEWQVAPGETYSFRETYVLLATFDHLVLFTSDPVAGTAIPEPAIGGLVVLGGLLLRRRRV